MDNPDNFPDFVPDDVRKEVTAALDKYEDDLTKAITEALQEDEPE